MAGCKPEYLPVVLAAVEAACTDHFNIHGLLCTTYFCGPVLMVNGPITTRIGMNCRQQRAGPGQPGQRHDRPGAAARRAQRRRRQARRRRHRPGRLRQPGQVHVLLRRERGRPARRAGCRCRSRPGHAPGTDTVTLFGGHGASAIVDQLSRSAEDLIEIFVRHVQLRADPFFARRLDNLVLVIGPEHGRVFSESGWDKARVRAELNERIFAGSQAGRARAELGRAGHRVRRRRRRDCSRPSSRAGCRAPPAAR